MIKRFAANGIKRFFENRGYSINRPRFHEENAIDLRKLLAEPIEKRKGRLDVLQIGANDGVTNDPIHPAVLSRGWNLVAVEPMPAPFAKLRETYRGVANVICVQCAIGNADGEAVIYALRPVRNAGVYDEHLASFSLETLKKSWRSIPDLDKRIEKHFVKSLTLKSLMRHCNLNEVDMLQVDVEGFDYNIIRAAFEMQLFPKILAFEWSHLTKGPRKNKFIFYGAGILAAVEA